MKRLLLTICAALCVLALLFAGCAPQDSGGQGGNTGGGVNDGSAPAGNILVTYFSSTGNTQGVAAVIAGQTSGTLWEIVPAVPYTAEDLNYSNSNCRARQEYENAACRPEIDGAVEDMAVYSAVFVGYPIWWGSTPRIIQTFLESYNFGSTPVYVFSTSASSGGSGAYNALVGAYPAVNFSGSLHFTASQLSSSQSRVSGWLEACGVI